MRIGVDATCWSNRRGYGRFARALLTAARQIDDSNQYVFFTDQHEEEFPFPADVEIVRVVTGTPTIKAAGANGHRGLRDMWNLGRAISSAPLDLVFFPSVYSYVPLTTAAPKLITIHDTIPEFYPEMVFPTRQSKLFWRAKVRLACAQARLILTVSDYAKDCLAQMLRIRPERLRVVQEASDPAFRPVQAYADVLHRLRIPADARVMAFVGGFSPHKNLPLLVDLLRELKPHIPGLHLVFVGDHQKDVFFSCYQEISRNVQDAGLGESVTFTGYLPDDDIAALLSAAAVLLLPSFSEGVGLPALEAAACGTPVIATTRSPLAGLLGEGAICLDPDDREGWRKAVFDVFTTPGRAAQMRAAGLAATARLSWESSARQLLQVFQEVRGVRAASA